MGSGGGSPFPEVLEEEILVRLPVESLLRFKCICKNWNRIIKKSDFIKEHYRKKKAHKVVVYDDSVPRRITLISEDGLRAAKPSPNERFRGKTYLSGSVDGLFLVKKKIEVSLTVHISSLSLWNPATREVWPIPYPNFKHQSYDFGSEFTSTCGFGLDTVTDDYKVVWLSFFSGNFGINSGVHAKVYSCSKDSWRTLQLGSLKHTSYIRKTLSTCYSNGMYYWLVQELDEFNSYGKCRILSFDFGTEEFRDIEGPDDGPPFNRTSVSLMLFDDDSIALITNVAKFDYQIWVMIRSGLWNKRFVFKCFAPNIFSIKCWVPSTSSVIFITRRSSLISCDIRTRKIRRLALHYRALTLTIPGSSGVSIHTYKESLVTIKRKLQLT